MLQQSINSTSFCSMTYGTPDTALMELIAMTIVIMKNPVSKVHNPGKVRNSSQTRQMYHHQRYVPTRKEKYLRWVFYAWIIFVYISNSISNFMTGIHSVDQIFFGTCLGVWLGYFCNAVVRKPTYEHVTRLLNGEYHAQGYGRLLKYLFLIWLVNFLIITSIYFWVRSYEK